MPRIGFNHTASPVELELAAAIEHFAQHQAGPAYAAFCCREREAETGGDIAQGFALEFVTN